jgi:hypothetical protein
LAFIYNIKILFKNILLNYGAIAFVLTLVYIIEAGIIFTQHVDRKNYNIFAFRYSGVEVRIDSDGAFLK